MLLLYYHTNYKLIDMVAICAGPHNATGQVWKSHSRSIEKITVHKSWIASSTASARTYPNISSDTTIHNSLNEDTNNVHTSVRKTTQVPEVG